MDQKARAIVVSQIKNIVDEITLDELKGLLKTLDIEVVDEFRQNTKENPRYLVGSGKLQEIKEGIEISNANMVVFDNTLTGNQIRNLEEALKVDVVDRNFIILQIFAKNAKTTEGILEVNLALKRYMLPRLGGSKMYSGLSRQGGGYNAKGPGETKLETDQRKILSDIHNIKKRLEGIKTKKEINSNKRKNNNIPVVALVGYTNAGKSSLFNNLSSMYGKNEQVLEKNEYFSTLGTKYTLINKGRPFILVDSVGFISKLPVDLVNSFYSTLYSVKEASLIIHVEDGSLNDGELLLHSHTSAQILEDLLPKDTPIIKVLTHSDIKANAYEDIINISNITKDGIDSLFRLIEFHLTSNEKIYQLKIKSDDYKNISYIRSNVRIIKEHVDADYVVFRVSANPRDIGLLNKQFKKSAT